MSQHSPHRINIGMHYHAFDTTYDPVKEIDQTPFVYQDYLQDLIRLNRFDTDLLVRVPDRGDPLVWQYEHLRQFCLELSEFVIAIEPECTPDSCAVMKANEWQYLCAAHATPQSCTAFDYIVHTLDGACTLLNNHPKHFPSRHPTLGNLARRLYRIFAHTYFHHQHTFHMVEASTCLYARFLKFILKFELLAKESILIPANI